MGEWEALIQRRKMLLENVSKINYEVEKIDQRLAYLEKIADSEHSDRYRPQRQIREPSQQQIVSTIQQFTGASKRSSFSN
jgi:hypothetical protein